MMKRILALMLAALMMLTAFAMAETAEPETAEGADSDWYMKVLDDGEITGQFPYCCFADVNGDGVPVLIVTTTADDFIGAEDYGRVYVYDAGGPKLAMEVGGAGGDRFYCNDETHTLTHYYRFSGEGHIEVFELGNGALKPVTQVDSYGPFHAPTEDNADSVYFQDGQEIDEAACEALFDRYAADDDVLTYQPVNASE